MGPPCRCTSLLPRTSNPTPIPTNMVEAGEVAEAAAAAAGGLTGLAP